MKTGWKWAVVAAAAMLMSAGVYTQVSAQTESKIKATLSKKVTKRFNNAKLDDVLAWLKTQGVSFVVRPGSISKDARITVNIVDQPLEDAVDAIASAFDSRWDREGQVFVLKPGPTMWKGDFEMPKIEVWDSKDMPKFLGQMPKFDDKTFKAEMDELNKKLGTMKLPAFDEAWHKNLAEIEKLAEQAKKETGKENLTDEDLKKYPELKKKLDKLEADTEKWGNEFGEKFGKEMEAWGEEFGKKMELRAKDFEKLGEMDAKTQKEFAEKMELKAKEMAKAAEAWEKQGGKEFEKQMELHGKEMEKLQAELEKKFGKDFEAKMKAHADRLEKELKNKDWGKLEGKNWMVLKDKNVKELLKSLTETQKSKQKDRGYLLPEDLTPAQRELLGTLPEGSDWSITYTVDGQTITVKGK